MKLFGLRIHVVFLVFVLGLAAALGGQRLYLRHQVEAPLAAELAALDGVEDVSLETGPDGVYQVRVWVAPRVRLAEVYRAVRERVDGRLGPQAVVDLRDRRSPELVAAWDAMVFALEEGAATGRLEAMRQRVEALAAERGVESRLFVDAARIYVTLEKDGGYLHEVVQRQVTGLSGADGLPERGRGGA